MTSFCKDIIDVVSFESSDLQDLKQEWKERCEESKAKEGCDEDEAQKEQVKLKNKILFVTPLVAQTIFGKNGFIKPSNSVCVNMVIDKINLHQAFDLDQDLIELQKTAPNFPKPS